MSFALRERGVRAIVLDIEGTTTPIGFVYDVLFPFARAHLRDYLSTADTGELTEPLRRLRAEWSADAACAGGPPDWPLTEANASGPADRERSLAGAAAYVEWLMDRDRKSPGLKLLQGRIWERGFRTGVIRGEVFHDVPRALERWREGATDVAIYSSGSQLAQQLLFSSTPAGDLTRFICRFFDTDIGPKLAADSYRRIASELVCPADRMLFISDAAPELDAARTAGCQVLICLRPGNQPQATGLFASIATFDEIV